MLKKMLFCTLSLINLCGCYNGVTNDPSIDTALLGAAIGAGAGQVFGGDTRSTVIGGLVGAGGGYIAGESIKRQKAEQQAIYSRVRELEQTQNQIVVRVQNSNGSFTDVVLTKDGAGGYIGPKGERYITLPTPEQLKPVYGF